MATPEEALPINEAARVEEMDGLGAISVSEQSYAKDIHNCLTPAELVDKLNESCRVRVAWLDGPSTEGLEFTVLIKNIESTDDGHIVTVTLSNYNKSDDDNADTTTLYDVDNEGRMRWTTQDGVIKTTLENVGYFVRPANE